MRAFCVWPHTYLIDIAIDSISPSLPATTIAAKWSYLSAKLFTAHSKFRLFMYLRFVRPNKIQFMAARAGFLDAAYEMRSVRTNDQNSSALLETHLAWFRENLAIPKRFTRSKSKGAWRSDATKGLSWFKAEALEMLAHAHDLTAFLMENGYPITILRTERIGYVIYEDAHQAVAEPFADTPI